MDSHNCTSRQRTTTTPARVLSGEPRLLQESAVNSYNFCTECSVDSYNSCVSLQWTATTPALVFNGQPQLLFQSSMDSHNSCFSLFNEQPQLLFQSSVSHNSCFSLQWTATTPVSFFNGQAQLCHRHCDRSHLEIYDARRRDEYT